MVHTFNSSTQKNYTEKCCLKDQNKS
ncbi:rCG39873 [Rattus norvegicus]|uniref:RCG39873 n=1 Tax=Rattus norvegicus TaxID=10116 RepID=A6I984_RAT|nr:rCG39873 [Rattus norvegicus]